jgi:hypothetical protein
MTGDLGTKKRSRLIRLMRRIAREEAWQIMDEHLSDYVHEEKPVEEVEIQRGE